MQRSIRFLIIFVFMVSLTSCGKKKEAADKPIKSGTAEKGDAGYDFKYQVEKLTFNWKVQGDKLKVKLSAETAGWVGIGFNPSTEMKDANFIIGYVKEGKSYVVDHFGVANRMHKADKDLGGADNVKNGKATEKGKVTEVVFTIPLKSGDKLDSAINAKSDITILLSYGETDRLVQQHKMRSKSKINLSSGKYSLLLEKTI